MIILRSALWIRLVLIIADNGTKTHGAQFRGNANANSMLTLLGELQGIKLQEKKTKKEWLKLVLEDVFPH